MKKKSLSVLLFATLVLSALISIPAMAESSIKIVVQLKGGLDVGQHLQAAINDTETFAEWHVVFNDLNSTDLTGADMLILIQSDMSVNYTQDELDAVYAWYQESGKTLWVAADSDFSDQYMRVPTANEMLEKVGSRLRAENAEAADPTSNGGAPYRVLGVSDYCDEEVDFLVEGVERALFHGPGLIIGYEDGAYTKLESSSLDNVYVIMTTSTDGIIEEYTEPQPEIHEVGNEGTFPLMVLEVMDNGNALFATADSPFAHYTPMYSPEIAKPDRYGVEYPQQGATLFQNIVSYAKSTVKSGLNYKIIELGYEIDGLENEVSNLENDKTALQSEKATLESDLDAANGQVGTWQMYAGLALLIGLIVGVLVGPMIKK